MCGYMITINNSLNLTAHICHFPSHFLMNFTFMLIPLNFNLKIPAKQLLHHKIKTKSKCNFHIIMGILSNDNINNCNYIFVKQELFLYSRLCGVYFGLILSGSEAFRNLYNLFLAEDVWL